MGKLIRLELFNFKSYKGHHNLLFGDAYFTSIIGPNGSGKSNSMDAISFVLGIKSSHLRSSHLRDLVYRGRVLKTSKVGTEDFGDKDVSDPSDKTDNITESPTSESIDPKSAWVMAVYEDDAGDKQKWKRTITNQGVSEYRINDRVVTAVQYNEALESENILIKARNFLVFQGDVEAIASQSPKDLTKLIEQISGSLEYKAEYERLEEEAKRTAENQLYNLSRRRGINSEIKQYQEQKREAEAFQAKANERDLAIITHILWELYNYQLEMNNSIASIEENRETLKEYRRRVEKYEKSVEEARQAQAKVSKDVSRIERTIKKKEREVEGMENNLVPIDEKLEITDVEIGKTRKKIESLSNEQEKHNREILKLQKDLAAVEKAEKESERKWQEILKKQGKKLSDEDFKEYNSLRSQLAAKTAAQKAKLDNYTRQMKTDQVALNSLKVKLTASQVAVDRLQSEVDEISERKASTEADVKETMKQVESKKKELNQLISERIRVNQLHTEKEEKLRTVLKEIADADAGRRKSLREQKIKETVAALKRLYGGVRGRIGDLCKPKQKKYDEAVITALGRDFDSVVVDTEKTGTECVQYLKDQRANPMTFIPLDNIKVSAPDANLKGLPKARLTIDTIDFDPSIERAMAYACGNSIVCDDLAAAKHICYEKHIHVKAVTLQGYVIHKAGLMTGGRGPEKGDKRKFDDQDIDKLRAQVTRFQNEIDALPDPHRRGIAEEALQNELAGLDQRFLYTKNELAAFEQNLTSKKRQLEFEQGQLKDIQPKFNSKEIALHSIMETVAEAQKEVDQEQDELFAEFCKRLNYSNIRDYEAQQGSFEQQNAEERNKFSKHKASLQNQINWLKGQYDDVTRRITVISSRVESLEAQILTYQQDKQKLDEAINVGRAQITELEDELHKYKEKYAQKTTKVNQTRSDLTKQNKKLEEINKEISVLEMKAQRKSVERYSLLRRCKLEQISIPLKPGSKKLDSLPIEENSLQTDPEAMDIDEDDAPSGRKIEDYGIIVDTDRLDEDLTRSSDEETGEKLLQRINDLNAELEKLNPNMRATERLESVEIRLKTAEREFENARKSAKKAKEEFELVKEKRCDLFNKAFTHISEQISHVYKDLTRSSTFPLGGQAYLDIEESDAPYYSGIKYHAMPPLKRFRDMEHLSGGEKTMAALALLFAVHSFQPSPFFVLDEVDAALDNANVEKIKNYIREHAGPGMQFIVISLKTGLFQGSESLIGVFRDQDANSSKTLTLDLRKYR
ncbi:Structural maintenance of chromosomes protein 1 [Golovinomyces cichoracearum]|uniref:Structural maintenance of chromosomes protein n=1 Tax=Golovinomyces cichoracearum TaxID=62708 RepID=A0A420HGL7_9PEZI|nr:Structural maintenance of chromosomes protein 1 [Golovinomyces cichoracearum]